MKSRLGGLRRQFLNNHLMTTNIYSTDRKNSAEKEENVIHWTTLFRRNWHIYAEMILGIELRPFQKIMLYLMGISEIFFGVCSRGLSKL